MKIEVLKEGPGHIGRTIDARCKDPSQMVFAQALLDKALEDYFLIQLAMLANTKVNAYVTIADAAGQAAGSRQQNEREKSKTSPNLRVGLPQFSTLGSL